MFGACSGRNLGGWYLWCSEELLLLRYLYLVTSTLLINSDTEGSEWMKLTSLIDGFCWESSLSTMRNGVYWFPNRVTVRWVNTSDNESVISTPNDD